MSGTLYLLPTVISEETLTSVIPTEVREKARQIDHFLVEAAKTRATTSRISNIRSPLRRSPSSRSGTSPIPRRSTRGSSPFARALTWRS